MLLSEVLGLRSSKGSKPLFPSGDGRSRDHFDSALELRGGNYYDNRLRHLQ